MLITPHALVGATLAVTVPPPLGLGLAFVSHPILDMVPHWDWDPKETDLRGKAWGLFWDMGLSLLLLFSFSFFHAPDLLWLGAFLGVFLDVLSAPYTFFGIEHPWVLALYRFQKKIQVKTSLWPGLLPQVAIGLICLGRLLR